MRMNRKNLFMISLLAVLIVATGVMVFYVWPRYIRSSLETDRLLLTWERTGKPLVVEGVVLDAQRRPIPGQFVDMMDDSGGQCATTDAAGRFSVHLGENELTNIDLPGLGSASMRVSCARGLNFTIVVK